MHLQWPLIREDYNRNRQTTALFSMDAVIRGHGIGVHERRRPGYGGLGCPSAVHGAGHALHFPYPQLPATSTPYSALPPVAWGPVT